VVGWRFNDANTGIPEAVYCHSLLNFKPANNWRNNPDKAKDVTVSIGNTGVQALSAYLAHSIFGEDTSAGYLMEEQLESLLASKSIAAKELDMGARFKESRHEKGFKAESGGNLWEIRPSNQKNKEADKNNNHGIEVYLPPGCATMLDDLNNQQQLSNQLTARLRHKKHILFADWYKYMVCAYPPDDGRQNYPDIDLVKYYIEKHLNEAEPLMPIKPPILPKLHKLIQQFNDSDLPNLSTYKFNKKDANIKGITFTATWTKNLPFSDDCIQFSASAGNYFELPISGELGVKAISLWINILSAQNNDAVLLATKQEGALLGYAAKNLDGWEKIAINGRVLPATETYQWRDLPTDQWFHLYLEWKKPLKNDDIIWLFAGNSSIAFLNGKLAALRLFAASLNEDELMCDRNILGHMNFELKERPGPRFWQPTEPVVLMEGNAVKPTNRHGADGRLNRDNTLTCDMISCDASWQLSQSGVDKLSNDVKDLENRHAGSEIGCDTWTGSPWHPFLLEWDVEVHPMEAGGNLAPDKSAFDPDFIIRNYSLIKEDPDLTPLNTDTTDAAARYRGRSILSPHTKNGLLKTIDEYLKHLKQDDCYLVLSAITKEQKKDYQAQLQKWFGTKPAISDWYSTVEDYKKAIELFNDWNKGRKVFINGTITELSALPAQMEKDFINTLIRSALHIFNKHFLSQALSGFNNALLMHHQTLQLPVADPLGFPGYRQFTDRVKSMVENNNILAPEPHNDFLPIRSGKLKIYHLRLIDSFGQIKDLSVSTFMKSEALTHKDVPDYIWLPPRLVPPARLNLRWLSAATDKQDLNTSPISNPICGWLMANHLDSSIMVYGEQGHVLGNINQHARWQTAPGSSLINQISDITNPHLRKVVARLAVAEDEDDQIRHAKESFLQDFIAATDRAAEHMCPDAGINHQETALLMGLPMAIVRVSVALQTKEGFPVHHGWEQFISDLQKDTRETNDFEKVKIPVQLGDRHQLNDGVIGYWLENRVYELEEMFYTTGKAGNNDEDVDLKSLYLMEIEDKGSADLQLSLEAASFKTLTMLVDPRGDVHATTGVLPVKTIHIPRDMYADALKNIQITFVTMPVLTDANEIALPLPQETGYEWSWLAKDRTTWVEITQKGIVRKDDTVTRFDNPNKLWNHLLEKGWLIELDGNRASIVPANERKSHDLDAPYDKIADKIQHWLNAGHILPADTGATFQGKQVIREGWLKLTLIK
jgi:hypothetical protein